MTWTTMQQFIQSHLEVFGVWCWIQGRIYRNLCRFLYRFHYQVIQEASSFMRKIVYWLQRKVENYKSSKNLYGRRSGTCFKFSPRIASAKERIRQVASNLKTLQGMPTGPTGCGWMTEVLALLPEYLIRLLHDNMMMTFIMTSIPGPEVEIPMLGDAKLTGMCWALSHVSNVGKTARI